MISDFDFVRWGNGYTTTLPLEVFTRRNFVADFIRLKLTFTQKTKKIALRATLSGLRGNVRTPSYSSLESPWSTFYSS